MRCKREWAVTPCVLKSDYLENSWLFFRILAPCSLVITEKTCWTVLQRLRCCFYFIAANVYLKFGIMPCFFSPASILEISKDWCKVTKSLRWVALGFLMKLWPGCLWSYLKIWSFWLRLLSHPVWIIVMNFRHVQQSSLNHPQLLWNSAARLPVMLPFTWDHICPVKAINMPFPRRIQIKFKGLLDCRS